ncbi:MAG: hypothetical protein ILA39_02710 [Bacteroidaceae bacterium]|nr:hypothetical protein [Bacteroidaceae bacterium]
MFSYQHNLNQPTKAVTREVFWGLLRDPKTIAKINKYRETGDGELKRSLPAFMFQATFDETKNKKGKVGRWRVQAATRLTGLVVMDVDNVDKPREVFEKWKTPSPLPLKGEDGQGASETTPLANREGMGVSPLGESPILLVYITPSGKGLKIVFKARTEWGNLIDNQHRMAELLGVEVDESCKDSSRMSFVCREEDVLFINEEELFSYENKEFAAKYEEAYRNGESAATQSGPSLAPPVGGRITHGEENNGENDSTPLATREGSGESPLYHGVPYSKIVEAWLKGKQVKKGDRHRTSMMLANQLRYITDNDAKLIERILREVPFVREIMEERNEDVAATIEHAMKQTFLSGMPKRMSEAVKRALQMENDSSLLPKSEGPRESPPSNIYATLPLDEWASELKSLTPKYPCMKELFRNLHPHKMPAVLFSSAAMFGTLMTRAWYHFWYEPEIERRLNYCIFVIGDPGAGKNVIEKFYHILAQPMLEADQPGIDALNKYKDSRTERTTSTKAQKGDALKKPNVVIRVHPSRTSTGEFIRHMIGAVEEVGDKKMNLHMFSFDSELDNVTKNNKGGDWKDREVMELKAFHNEQDGQMYANQESISGMFHVYWNFIYTGTPYALARKITQRNFGSGMSTRLAVIPMPDEGMAERKQKVDLKANDVLREWASRLDKVQGEIPIEPLNDVTYDWQAGKMEMADFNEDKAERSILKRIPYYGIGVSLPFILMRHWKEWTEKKTLKMDDTDKQLCLLAMDIQYRTQQFFFGEMARRYYEDQNKAFEQVQRSTRYQVCYRKLPEQFGIEGFMQVFGLENSSARKALTRLVKENVIKRMSRGKYEKRLKELQN